MITSTSGKSHSVVFYVISQFRKSEKHRAIQCGLYSVEIKLLNKASFEEKKRQKKTYQSKVRTETAVYTVVK